MFGFKKSKDQTLYSFIIVRELPERIKDNVIYIEGDVSLNDFWYALLKCPCGCNENIMLNLMEDANPSWKVTVIESRVSVSPSIWRTVNCKSHFWLNKSKVIWV